jgi:hypothetical protein
MRSARLKTMCPAMGVSGAANMMCWGPDEGGEDGGDDGVSARREVELKGRTLGWSDEDDEDEEEGTLSELMGEVVAVDGGVLGWTVVTDAVETDVDLGVAVGVLLWALRRCNNTLH